MKQSKTFIGVLLIGFGLFFVLQQYSIPILSRFDTWPTILIILGMAFLAQGYLNKQPESILPEVFLLVSASIFMPYTIGIIGLITGVCIR